MTVDVTFRGLKAPLRLVEAEALLPLLSETLPGWLHGALPADPDAQPFYTITGHPESDRLFCEPHVGDRPARSMNAVDAICDAIAELAVALPAEDDRVLCLHAAGVVLAGRVVVFPNVRRAGKSTLSAALAWAGHQVFSDDVLPVAFPGGQVAMVESMGVAPRLRLPLPDSLPQGFRDWAASVAGPQNRRYRYLTLPDAPTRGDSLPLGAFVLLDRQEDPCPVRLDPVPTDAAMDALLHQNFTRDRHSGDILDVMAATLAALPVWRLTYSGLEEALACLQAAFVGWPPLPEISALPVRFRIVEPGPQPPVPAPDAPLAQRAGSTARTIGEALYLADPEGRAIHRMDPLAAAIWDMLEEPATADEIAALLAEAFPDTGRDRLHQDVAGLLSMMAGAGLIG